jgi:fimbrial chaperone protein
MKGRGMGRFFAVFTLLIWGFAAVSPAAALKITPFKVSVAPGTQGATQVFRIENNSAAPAAIQVSALTWDIGPDGREINHDAEDEFIVFPAQLVLAPYESKSVRVQWLGDTPLESERAYRLLAEQIPVSLQNTPPSGIAVRFLLRFKAALYVTPPHARSDIQLQDAVVMQDRLRVTVVNKGTRHGYLGGITLHLEMQNGKSITLTGDALAAMAGENIHARASRIFDLPRPAGLTEGVKSARIEVGGAR